MEHAIGEIVTLPDNRVVEVVLDTNLCEGCALDGEDCISLRQTKKIGWCFWLMRTDHNSIIYKEVK